jgi:hypothetical protein
MKIINTEELENILSCFFDDKFHQLILINPYSDELTYQDLLFSIISDPYFSMNYYEIYASLLNLPVKIQRSALSNFNKLSINYIVKNSLQKSLFHKQKEWAIESQKLILIENEINLIIRKINTFKSLGNSE